MKYLCSIPLLLLSLSLRLDLLHFASGFSPTHSPHIPSPQTQGHRISNQNVILGSKFRSFPSISRGTISFATTEETGQEESSSATAEPLWTEEELHEFCDQQGVVLSLSTLGPGYRSIARAKHNRTMILGYVEGFVRPTGNLLHLDKMEVYDKMVKKTRKENGNEFKGGGTFLGVGLLMAYLCLLHGKEQGCSQGEFLAIDDETYQHKRLVRYYSLSGFEIIKYVGDDFQDIPDRMVWGGCGTLMRQDIDFLLKKWTDILNKSREKMRKRLQQEQEQNITN